MYHEIVVVGRLGNEPELKYMPNGMEVTNFSLITSRTQKDGTESKLWFSVGVFGHVAVPCAEYLHKGSKVFVSGRLQGDEAGNPRTFTRKDGTTGSEFKLTTSNVVFLDGKSDAVDAPQESDAELW
jgi:single-strand DNA-binding protein